MRGTIVLVLLSLRFGGSFGHFCISRDLNLNNMSRKCSELLRCHGSQISLDTRRDLTVHDERITDAEMWGPKCKNLERRGERQSRVKDKAG